MSATIFYGTVFTDLEYQIYIDPSQIEESDFNCFNILHKLYSESELSRRVRDLEGYTSQIDPNQVATQLKKDVTDFGEKLTDLGYELRTYVEEDCLQFCLCSSLLKEHICDGHQTLNIKEYDEDILIDDLNKAVNLIQEEIEKRVGIRPDFGCLERGWHVVIDWD